MSGERTIFRNVIVGADGRAGGRDAIALARMLVASAGRLTLAHIHSGEALPASVAAAARADAAGNAVGEGASDSAAGPAPAPGGNEESQRLLERERAKAEVEAQLMSVGASSIGRGLHQLAEDEHADLIVVGSSHRGFLGRVLIGDDTRASLNGAPCAIAVAPLGYTQTLADMTTIGVGYDGSAESEAALALARRLASEHGATLRAIKVVQILSSAYAGFGGTAWGDALETVLAEAKEQMAALEGVQGEATVGVAGEELAAFGEGVDLLVVGSRGYGPVRALMLGSTSHYLSAHARCPLLVLPRASTQPSGGEPPAAAAGDGSAGAV
jgi:nucleotide-binding universal stress UspA family protein